MAVVGGTTAKGESLEELAFRIRAKARTEDKDFEEYAEFRKALAEVRKGIRTGELPRSDRELLRRRKLLLRAHGLPEAVTAKPQAI
jgi:hypothetical protein